MQYKAAVFDIDGTLLPKGHERVSPAVVRALAALRSSGTAILVATGRPLFAARPVLAGVPADYIVAANGGWVVDGQGRTLHTEQMTEEEMYALVDFCEDYEVPLSFTFSDGYYGYVESARLFALSGLYPTVGPYMHDGEDQVRHRQGMPCAATAFITPEQAARFTDKYGYLGIRFLPFAPGKCDVVRAGVDKAVAVERLLAALKIKWACTAAFGDGPNDAALLARAGLAVAMANGTPSLWEAAHLVAPACEEEGVARVIAERLLNHNL